MAEIQFYIITIFPEIFDSFKSTSLVGKAVDSGVVDVLLVDPRDFTPDRHNTVDDAPFGGGEGMVMKPEPLVAAMESIPGSTHRVLLSPQGKPLNQARLAALARHERLTLICGRYEGFDERVREYVDEEISLGDFVLQGGETAAMALIEGVSRLIPGVIGNAGSLSTESHGESLLEYPQYTRPRIFRDQPVPEVLLGGHHKEIQRWRREMMLRRTRQRRPDLWARFQPTAEDNEILQQADGDPLGALAARTYIALLHHPVVDRLGKVVTTAVTNLDIHDIARSSRTYGLAAYFIVTPLTSQRELVGRIISHWRTGHGAQVNKRRSEALSLLHVEADLEDVIQQIQEREGQPPITVVTSAIRRPGQVSQQRVLDSALGGSPLLFLLGTGWGLTDQALARADMALAPLEGSTAYNHLSVRSAAAILLDRFFGMSH